MRWPSRRRWGGWLIAGRSLTAILDRLPTIGLASLPVSPLRYDGGGWKIGGLSLTFGAFDNLRYPLSLDSSISHRVSLTANARKFDLGRRTNPPNSSGRPEIEFVAGPGDALRLTSSQSVLGWPTPFEYRLIGGTSTMERLCRDPTGG